MMSDSNTTIEQLAEHISKDNTLDEFQLYEETRSVLKAGFNNNDLGGIYQPIQNHTHSRVSYLITTKDNKQAKGSLNPFAIKDIDTTINFIKTTASISIDKIKLAPKVTKFDPIKLKSSQLEDIIKSKPEEIVEYTKMLFEDQKSLGLKTIESQVSMRYNKKRFLSSNGNDMSSIDTLHDYYIDYNSEISASNESCDFIPTSEFSKTHKIAQLAKSLRSKKIKLDNKNLPVLFSPYYGSGILDKYILENINGTLIESSVSRFDIEDFANHKQIARNNISIEIDQTVPMNTDSFNFTTEGIAGQKFTIVENGKLTTPICDLQVATKLGYNPLVLPSLSGANFDTIEFAKYIDKYPKFILILSVLGVHTQNEITGDYSLPCPSALYFEDGKIVGPINCVLTGNFFEKLNDDSLGFIKHPAFSKPLFGFDSQLSIKD